MADRPDVVRFDGFTLDRRSRVLLRGDETVPIGARAFDLLDLLIARRDTVLPRHEIMAVVWPGTVVGENNLNVQVANLRRILGADAIRTVPRRGLQFGLDAGPTPEASAPVLPDRPSVVVLPFATFGGAPELAWLADGFVEDITTELSRFRDLFVVARNSAFVYQQMPRDLRQIARELGVRYVVEGSVRATPDQVRVTAQLIDSVTGGHVWAETFDRKLADHFEAQAMVARAVTACLTPQIERAEAERVHRVPPSDLTSYDLARRAWVAVSSGEMLYDPAPREAARALARDALERDPRCSLALRALAWIEWWNIYHGTTASVPATLTAGIEAATAAIEIDATDHHARRLRAQLYLMGGDTRAGLPELRRAHEINPNCATTLGWLGCYEALNGQAALGVQYANAGLRRSPCDPARGSMLCMLGFAEFAARNYAATVQAAEAALNEAVQGATPLILGAIGSVGLGHFDRAAETFAKAKDIAPKLVEARLAGRWLSSSEEYLTRAHTFFRVAAGEVPVSAVDPLR